MIAFLFLDLIQALVMAWPLWLTLIVIQVLFLFIGVSEYRWLPAGLLFVGLTYALVKPLFHG